MIAVSSKKNCAPFRANEISEKLMENPELASLDCASQELHCIKCRYCRR